MSSSPMRRLAVFAAVEVAIVYLVAFGVPALFGLPALYAPVTVAMGLMGGVYIGRAYERARITRQLEQP